MRLILAGCEYAGGTTMAKAVSGWMLEELSSAGIRIHDHWVYPFIADQDPTTCYVVGPDGIIPEEWRYGYLGSNYDSAKLTEDWASDVRQLKPWLLEQLQRIMVWRHIHHTVIDEPWDSIQVGLHYAEAVYAPLYYGYGKPGSFGDRRRRAREWDRALLEFAPETVLVLLRATPEAIRERMRAAPRPNGVIREEDIEKVIDLFEEQYAQSELHHKLAVQTSGVTAEESVAEFAQKVEPFLANENRRRRDETTI